MSAKKSSFLSLVSKKQCDEGSSFQKRNRLAFLWKVVRAVGEEEEQEEDLVAGASGRPLLRGKYDQNMPTREAGSISSSQLPSEVFMTNLSTR